MWSASSVDTVDSRHSYINAKEDRLYGSEYLVRVSTCAIPHSILQYYNSRSSYARGGATYKLQVWLYIRNGIRN